MVDLSLECLRALTDKKHSLISPNLSHRRHRINGEILVVGPTTARGVDPDVVSACQELRRQPYVPPGREICSATLSDFEGCHQGSTRGHYRAKAFKFRTKPKGNSSQNIKFVIFCVCVKFYTNCYWPESKRKALIY